MKRESERDRERERQRQTDRQTDRQREGEKEWTGSVYMCEVSGVGGGGGGGCLRTSIVPIYRAPCVTLHCLI